MQEQLISFETAKLAKEKGFDEICYYLYDLEEESIGAFENGKFHKNSNINLSIRSEDIVTAPTQSLLQKWLREKHNIIVIPDFHINKEKYFYWIINYKLKNRVTVYKDTYEEALEKGLYEALLLI